MVEFLILLKDGKSSQKAPRNQLVTFGRADDDDPSHHKLQSNNLRDRISHKSFELQVQRLHLLKNSLVRATRANVIGMKILS